MTRRRVERALGATNPLLAKVDRAIEDLDLCGRAILVACSGGPDSTALLLALAALKDARGLSIWVATFDHGLRPDSARDALYVERLCRALGLPCVRRRLDLGTRFAEGVEAAARAARYAALDEIAREVGAQVIATGHTIEDQVETVLMRLASGAGLAGARGIQRRRGQIVRPLLEVTRREVRDFLNEWRVRGRLDPTNSSPAFTRNRVRHQLLPALTQALGETSIKAIARFARVAERDERCLQSLAEQAFRRVCRPLAGGFGVEGSLDELRALDAALRFRLLRDAVSPLGVRLDFDAFERLESALQKPLPTRQTLPNGVELRLRHGRFEIGPFAPAKSPESRPPEPLRIEGPLCGRFQDWRVNVRRLDPRTAPAPGAVAIDATEKRLVWPLMVRTRAPGDVFAPASGVGRKKLKRWLIDAKIPREERDALALLTDASGEVLWVVGLKESRWTTRQVGPDGGFEVSIERAR